MEIDFISTEVERYKLLYSHDHSLNYYVQIKVLEEIEILYRLNHYNKLKTFYQINKIKKNLKNQLIRYKINEHERQILEMEINAYSQGSLLFNKEILKEGQQTQTDTEI